MKRIFFCLMASIAVLGSIEAQIQKPRPKPDTDTDKPSIRVNQPTTLSVSQTNINFGASGGTKRIDVYTNAGSWNTSQESAFCPVSKSGSSLILTCEQNNSSTPRNDYFQINAGNKSVRINVTQDGVQEYFSSDADRLRITDLQFANVNYNQKILNNYGYSLYDTTSYLKAKITYDNLAQTQKNITLNIKIKKPNGDLISGNGSSGGYSTSYSFVTKGSNRKYVEQELNGFGSREQVSFEETGTYTYEIWCSGQKLISKSFEIKSTKNNYSLSVSPTSIEFDADGGTKTINVSTNAGAYRTTSVLSWLSKNEYTTYLNLTCSPNPNTTERSDNFNIQAGGKTVTVYIRQKGKAAITNLEKGDWQNMISSVMYNVSQTLDNGKYKGQLSNGSRSGLGVYYWNENKDTYWGKWSSGTRDGYGIYLVNPSSTNTINNCSGCKYYVGDFSSGSKSGNGTCYDKSGNMIYYGKFSDGKPTETYTYPKSSYSTTYKFECFEYTDGAKYVGETKDGKRHGKGIYFWTDGSAWYGQWSDGSRSGTGIYFYYNGQFQTGKWTGDTYSAY